MKRNLLILALIAVLVAGGALGIRLFTGRDWIDSFYEAMLTLTTLGSSDVAPDSRTKLFIIAYLAVGLGFVSYGLLTIGQTIVNVDFQKMLERRRMDRKISALQGHYVVCGIGRMGRSIADYLSSRQRPFVLVDRNEAHLEALSRELGWLYVAGDATLDATLVAAGVRSARSLATVLPTDPDNVYVVLTARMLSPQVQIVARASDDNAIQKMERAGATRVISPFSSGAVKMARFMLHPSIEDFLEITDARGGELELADVQIPPSSPYVGKKLADTNLREQGVMVIGIRRQNGERLLPPPGNAVIMAGDSLFAFGSAAAVAQMIAAEE